MNWHKISMSFLEREIILYIDCIQEAMAEWGQDLRSMIARDGNIYLARRADDRDKAATVPVIYISIFISTL